MKTFILAAMVMALSGCAVARHIGGTDQCFAPTEREAKITKRVWK